MSQKSISHPQGADIPDESELQRRIIDVLDENQLMSLATLRSDGWPQVTVVNYFRDGRALYFLAARDSQKFQNIEHDPRVSIAIGGGLDHDGCVRAVSMSARVAEVVQAHRISEINALIRARPPERPFMPHPTSNSIAVFEARPEVVSLVDYSTPPGRRDLVRIVDAWRVERLGP